jgi:hypothetical protein
VAQLFGSWRAGLREIVGPDVVLSRGSRPNDYFDEDLIEAWRSCARYCGRPPGEGDYRAWRNHMRKQDGAYTAPSNTTIAIRLGGGRWSAVAIRLGVELPPARRPRTEFTPEELIAPWRACMEQLGHPPTRAGFEKWRMIQLTRDPNKRLPCSDSIARRLTGGAWSGIAAAQGVELPRLQNGRGNYDIDELLDVWRACVADLGRTPTVEAYDAWRDRALTSSPTGHVPCTRTMTKRLGGGSWKRIAAAVHRAARGRSRRSASREPGGHDGRR